ncbi:hypothetical protein [Paraburkholderia sediminicola]|uniref:hypothetical protein n=1 Tax=Paraburkholderia sediminicola TaxID=458836 RepID=UPI0038BABC06
MTPENAEDVSYGYVPGSVGSAGPVVTPWAARRAAMHDAARARCMPVIRETLSRFRKPAPRRSRAPVDAQAFIKARERFGQGA